MPVRPSRFSQSNIPLLLVLIAAFVASATAAADGYYDQFTEDQMHDDWIDLNANGRREPYEDATLSIDERVRDLIGRLTLEEKGKIMNRTHDPIEHLGLPGYARGEALHGVCMNGYTVFPTGVAMAATWNKKLVYDSYLAIGDEARAAFNIGQIAGPEYYSPPVVGIMRDSRWQRTSESLGEDPYLTSRLAATEVRAFQGEDDPTNYRKAVACAKHYVSNRGPMGRDHPWAEFSGPASERITREVSLRPYEACVTEANVEEVMSAYSGRPTGLDPNMVPCSYSRGLLTGILRTEWGFSGHVTSDCGAINGSRQRFNAPEITETAAGAAAAAIFAGCDLNCGSVYGSGAVVDAVAEGLITEQLVDQAVGRVLATRFELGVFDPPHMVPYSQLSENDICSHEHTYLALKAARECMVLLKNERDLLPLRKNLTSIAVLGPYAQWNDVGGHHDYYFGGYSGGPPYHVSPLEAIRKAVPTGTVVRHEAPYTDETEHRWSLKNVTEEHIEQARNLAAHSQVAIVFVGPPREGEGRTRPDLSLPDGHLEMLKAVYETGTPTVAIIASGSPLSSPWMKDNVPAIIQAWYAGMKAGTAIADVLFGDYNPGGKLCMTYPRPGRTPLYYNHKGEITYDETTYLWPFGYGLSYTEFDYDNLCVWPRHTTDGIVHAKVDVTNVGDRKGDAVVQLYLRDEHASVVTPVRQLAGFERVTLAPAQTKTVEFELNPKLLAVYDRDFNRVVEPGRFTLMIGESSQDIVLADKFWVTDRIELAGAPRLICTEASLSAETINADELLVVTATVKNVGGLTGWKDVVMKIDGERVASQTAGVGPRDTDELRFPVRLYKPGERSIEISGYPPMTVTVQPVPATFQYSDLSVPANAYADEPVQIAATVTNRGSYEATKKATLYIDGERVADTSVTVAPKVGGGRGDVTFSWRFEEPRLYEVAIADLTPQTVNVGTKPPSSFTDLSGSGNSAHTEGNPLWVEGKLGRALAFGGKQDALVVPDSESLRPKKEFSAGAWAKVNAPTQPDHNPILCKGKHIGFGPHYLFRIAVRGDGSMTWGAPWGSNEFWWDGGEAQLGEWAHYMVTYDGSTGRSYINGELVGEKPGGGLPLVTAQGQPLRSGSISRRPAAAETTVLNGTVDEITMYNRALTEQEIKGICKGTRIDDGLVLHLTLDARTR